MKFSKVLILSCLTIGVSNSTNAQLLKRLKEKVEQKIEDKIDKETDKVIDDALQKEQKEAKIDMPSTFSFTSSLEVEITANDDNSATIEILLGDYTNIYATSVISEDMENDSKAYNIVTPKSITMFMSVAGLKMKQSIAQNQMSSSNITDKIPTNPDQLEKTGATKIILGYTCYEYKYENEGGCTKVWATKDFPSKNKNISMLGMREGSVIEGFVLELETKSGNEIGKMKVVKFNKNKTLTINANEYKSM